ncbi:uncharacterized protein LOC119555132 [Drosophila subpulchrella]|uniref:uncharacterized protein LOC119555132 n=1 Tax=Drosophila subpulchrella TaxID=1486046 RepID=UPI0018A162EF|nr:uncharacterized protein LOC119555132 [Drosophila subpulchrella]
MGTKVEVIATCPFCDRHVSRDLRPINMLSASDAKRISQLINKEPPSIQLDCPEKVVDGLKKCEDSRCRNGRVLKRKVESRESSGSEDSIEEGPSLQQKLGGNSCSQEKLEEDSCSQEKLDGNSSQSETGSAEDDTSENSVDAITENILALVEKEFERDPACGGSSKILRGNAEVIMTMLTEEQVIIDKIEKQAARACQRDTEEPPAKRRKC